MIYILFSIIFLRICLLHAAVLLATEILRHSIGLRYKLLVCSVLKRTIARMAKIDFIEFIWRDKKHGFRSGQTQSLRRNPFECLFSTVKCRHYRCHRPQTARTAYWNPIRCSVAWKLILIHFFSGRATNYRCQASKRCAKIAMSLCVDCWQWQGTREYMRHRNRIENWSPPIFFPVFFLQRLTNWHLN